RDVVDAATGPLGAVPVRAARPLAVVALLGAAAALASFVLVGHSRSFGIVPLVMASDALHVLTGAVWFGGLIGLAVTLHRAEPVPVALARVVARFSTLAGWLVLGLAVTGVVLGWQIVGSVQGLLTPGYGWTLLAKVAVAVLVVAIGGWNRLRLVPRVLADAESNARARLRRTVATEATLLVLVLALTGMLVSQHPPPRDDPEDGAAAHTGTGEADTTDETDGDAEGELVREVDLDGYTAHVRATPGTRGPNQVQVQVTDQDGSPVVPQDPPRVEWTYTDLGIGPLTTYLQEQGDGTFTGDLTLPLAGTWEVEVGVRTSVYEDRSATLTVEVHE
ncbi:hypothetical protein N869_13355, partial [Cellulomonas bogoriensis 69B4 = DSM 16987]